MLKLATLALYSVNSVFTWTKVWRDVGIFYWYLVRVKTQTEKAKKKIMILATPPFFDTLFFRENARVLGICFCILKSAQYQPSYCQNNGELIRYCHGKWRQGYSNGVRSKNARSIHGWAVHLFSISLSSNFRYKSLSFGQTSSFASLLFAVLHFKTLLDFL